MNLAAMSHDEKLTRFRNIRRKLDHLSHDWQRGPTPTGEGILARLIEQGDLEPVLTFDAFADRGDIEFVETVPEDARFLVGLVIELDSELQALKPKPRKAPDYAAECAMKCKDADFQRFMGQVHGVENWQDPIRVDNRVKSMLRISSKTELNTNSEAATAWRELVNASEHWNKQRRRA